jgi:hypothetical protein
MTGISNCGNKNIGETASVSQPESSNTPDPTKGPGKVGNIAYICFKSISDAFLFVIAKFHAFWILIQTSLIQRVSSVFHKNVTRVEELTPRPGSDLSDSTVFNELIVDFRARLTDLEKEVNADITAKPLKHVVRLKALLYELKETCSQVASFRKDYTYKEETQKTIEQLEVDYNKARTKFDNEKKDQVNEIIKAEFNKIFKDIETASSDALVDLSNYILFLQTFEILFTEETAVLLAGYKKSVLALIEKLDKELIEKLEDEKNSKRTASIGFPNLGSSCYMNSTLQALLSCQSFKDLIRKPLVRKIEAKDGKEVAEKEDDFTKRQQIHKKLNKLLNVLEKLEREDCELEMALYGVRSSLFNGINP